MNEKEFDIIIKKKLETMEHTPSLNGWDMLQSDLLRQKADKAITNKTRLVWWKKIAQVAAILIPLLGIGYGFSLWLEKPSTTMLPVANNSNTTISEQGQPTDSIIQQPLKTVNKLVAESNISIEQLAPINAVKASFNKLSTAVQPMQKYINNELVQSPNVHASANTRPPSIDIDLKEVAIEADVKIKDNTIVLNNNSTQPNKDASIKPVMVDRNVASSNWNETHRYNTLKRGLNLAIMAAYGATKANAAIQQIGVIGKKSINKKLYADASILYSNQGGYLLSPNTQLENASTQDVNVLSGNYTTNTTISANQKARAANRIPISQLVCNPSIGYNTSTKSYVSIGAEFAKIISNPNTQALNTASASSNVSLDEWDSGLTAKLGYALSNRINSELKIRQGLTNVVENTNGNTKRSYALIGLSYKLK